MRHTALIAFES